MGDLVITLILEELGLIPEAVLRYPSPVLVTVFDRQSQLESIALSSELRSAGLNVTCYLQDDKLSRQLKYADRIGARVVVLLGPEEIAAGTVTLKDLANRSRQSVPREQAARAIREIIAS